MSNSKAVYVTETDSDRLEALLETVQSETAELLASELARAAIVKPEEIPPNVVTMNSRVRFRDDAGSESEVQLVYPKDADMEQNKLSVLAPVGAALLGLAEGDSIDWPTPAGKRTLTIIEVLFQPEAEGRFDL